MTASTAPDLEAAIRQSGEGWLIDWFRPQEKAMDHIRQRLTAICEVAQHRLAGRAPADLSERKLLEEYRRSPTKVRGFFQALGGTRSPEMLLMAWRIIQGMEVQDIQLEYRRQESFRVRVVLRSPYGEDDPPYESTNIHDFALFRHLGILEIGGRPVLDGFYPLKVRSSENG